MILEEIISLCRARILLEILYNDRSSGNLYQRTYLEAASRWKRFNNVTV